MVHGREVVQIANGASDTGTLNKMTEENGDLPHALSGDHAGAVRIKWPADLTREVPEPESWTWVISSSRPTGTPRLSWVGATHSAS